MSIQTMHVLLYSGSHLEALAAGMIDFIPIITALLSGHLPATSTSNRACPLLTPNRSLYPATPHAPTNEHTHDVLVVQFAFPSSRLYDGYIAARKTQCDPQ